MIFIPTIRDLSVILVIAGLVSILFNRIRQPVTLGYILSGLIVGPHTPPYSLVSDIPSIQLWGELGLTFLMFSLGLEFSLKRFASICLTAGITAGFEIGLMMIFGFLTGRMLQWSFMDSLFLAGILATSSTTIVLRSFAEIGVKHLRFAEIVLGVLIVEDLVAIFLLVVFASLANHQTLSAGLIFTTLWKLSLVIGTGALLGHYLLAPLMEYVGKVGTGEMLTIVSLALCLAFSVTSSYFHYPAALGAFTIGTLLAENGEVGRILNRLKPVRDLFAAIFFVSIGMLIEPLALWENRAVIIIISFVTIFGKALGGTLGAIISGENLKSSAQVGISITQLGEFSFIIAGLGVSLGVASPHLYPIAVAVSLITTFTTPYIIRASVRTVNSLNIRAAQGKIRVEAHESKPRPSGRGL